MLTMLRKIISGGKTGADRVGPNFAIEAGLERLYGARKDRVQRLLRWAPFSPKGGIRWSDRADHHGAVHRIAIYVYIVYILISSKDHYNSVAELRFSVPWLRNAFCCLAERN
jgi:hypothetical protein